MWGGQDARPVHKLDTDDLPTASILVDDRGDRGMELTAQSLDGIEPGPVLREKDVVHGRQSPTALICEPCTGYRPGDEGGSLPEAIRIEADDRCGGFSKRTELRRIVLHDLGSATGRVGAVGAKYSKVAGKREGPPARNAARDRGRGHLNRLQQGALAAVVGPDERVQVRQLELHVLAAPEVPDVQFLDMARHGPKYRPAVEPNAKAPRGDREALRRTQSAWAFNPPRGGQARARRSCRTGRPVGPRASARLAVRHGQRSRDRWRGG